MLLTKILAEPFQMGPKFFQKRGLVWCSSTGIISIPSVFSVLIIKVHKSRLFLFTGTRTSNFDPEDSNWPRFETVIWKSSNTSKRSSIKKLFYQWFRCAIQSHLISPEVSSVKRLLSTLLPHLRIYWRVHRGLKKHLMLYSTFVKTFWWFLSTHHMDKCSSEAVYHSHVLSSHDYKWSGLQWFVVKEM